MVVFIFYTWLRITRLCRDEWRRSLHAGRVGFGWWGWKSHLSVAVHIPVPIFLTPDSQLQNSFIRDHVNFTHSFKAFYVFGSVLSFFRERREGKKTCRAAFLSSKFDVSPCQVNITSFSMLRLKALRRFKCGRKILHQALPGVEFKKMWKFIYLSSHSPRLTFIWNWNWDIFPCKIHSRAHLGIRSMILRYMTRHSPWRTKII